jgi:D-alanine--poly(phosphoribitol) ligase subunit 1
MLDHIKTVFTAHAAKLAFCIGTQSYSYGEWLRFVNGIRQLLRKERPESTIIGLAAYDDIETYAAILALWAEGYAFVPLSPQSPAERNQNVMRQVNSNFVLSSRSSNLELMGEQSISWLQTKGEQAEGAPPDFSAIADEQILCMLFTSGSTGIPKGVPMTKRNINTTLAAFFEEGYQLSAEDRFLQMFELTFDMSMISYLPAWCIGASVHTVSSEGVKYLNAFKVMQTQALTFVTTVPSTLQLLRPYFSQIHLPSVRYSLQGGEPFYSDLAEAWMNCVPNATVVNLSGPCETTMACMSYPLDRNFANNKTYKNILAFGRPWKRTTVLLLNEKDEICTVGEEGELCFAGEHVMEGYWQLPEKNATVFFERAIDGKRMRFYRSGDMAFQDESGLYYSTGRKDIQYKIQGYKVELGDIEQHAQHFLQNGNAIAHVSRNVKGLLDIHLFVDKVEVDKTALAKYLREQLPNYMQPTTIRVLQKLPLTISGKLDRQRIAGIFEGDDFEYVTKTELTERVTHHLFAAYRAAATILEQPVWQKGNVEAVDVSPSSWPVTAFGNPEAGDLDVLAKAMLDKTIPARLIIPRPLRPETLYPQMTALGFKLLTSWPGMAMDLSNNVFTNDYPETTLISTEAQLEQWMAIVNTVLFTEKKLARESIHRLWSSGEFLFYGLSANGQLVASILAYPKEKELSLYMLAVEEGQRRKGYARKLMQSLLADAKQNAYRAAYLQATPMGLRLYEDLGFVRVGEFDIFKLENVLAKK